MHMCIAFFVYLSLWGYALAALRARTHEPETAHSRACDCALSGLRVRTHFPTPTHKCVGRIAGRVADMLVFEKKNQHSCIFL